MITLTNEDADYIANLLRSIINERINAKKSLKEYQDSADNEDDKNAIEDMLDLINNNDEVVQRDVALNKSLELVMIGSKTE